MPRSTVRPRATSARTSASASASDPLIPRPRADGAGDAVRAGGLLLEPADVLGAWALGVLDEVELHPLPLCQRLEAAPADRGVVHEHVLAARVRLDEAEALLVHEPFHGARLACHFVPRRSRMKADPAHRRTSWRKHCARTVPHALIPLTNHRRPPAFACARAP